MRKLAIPCALHRQMLKLLILRNYKIRIGLTECEDLDDFLKKGVRTLELKMSKNV